MRERVSLQALLAVERPAAFLTIVVLGRCFNCHRYNRVHYLERIKSNRSFPVHEMIGLGW